MNFFKSGGKPFFDVTESLIENIRTFIVNVGWLLTDIAAELGPWFAPAAPAMFSYIHLTEYMGFTNYTAIPVALAIEFVGLASTGTLISTWIHNQRHTAQKDQVPIKWLVGIFVWYLVTVILLNVALSFAAEFLATGKAFESEIGFGIIVILVQATVVLLEVPAAAIIGFRSSYRELLESISDDKEKRRIRRNRTATQSSSNEPIERTTNRTSSSNNGGKTGAVRDYMEYAHTEEGRIASFSEVSEYLEAEHGGAAKSTVSKARNDWIEEFGLEDA